MIRVEARNGEPLEKTIRRFKKRCEKEGLTKDIKKNMYYDKPSEVRRRESRKLEKRILQERHHSSAPGNAARCILTRGLAPHPPQYIEMSTERRPSCRGGSWDQWRSLTVSLEF
jgi:small subunit ribosomal protein S21